MDKLTYLRRVFEHTKGKTFENYVINQIWVKVEDFGLYPITQQYVKRSNGYALIDLYFPQINFGVEVYEEHHQHIIESDEMRIEDIFSSISDISIAIIKEDNYESVKTQIENTVKEIKNKVIESGPFEWEDNWKEKEYLKKLSIAKNKRKLEVSDFISFKRVQVTNDIFNMNLSKGFLQYGKSFFKLSDKEYIWFPHLTKQKDWENIISDDWNYIYERYIGNDEKIKNTKILPDDLIRYTFAKYQDSLGEISYRFIGVFMKNETRDRTEIHKRIRTTIDL